VKPEMTWLAVTLALLIAPFFIYFLGSAINKEAEMKDNHMKDLMREVLKEQKS